MTSDHDGRKLVAELLTKPADESIDAVMLVSTLHDVADRLDAALKVANDLYALMDAVHEDRVAPADSVVKLTAERNSLRYPAEEDATALAD